MSRFRILLLLMAASFPASWQDGAQNFAVTVGHAVQLAWVASTSPFVASYNVYRSTTGSPGTFSQIATVLGVSYQDQPPPGEQTYWYYVTAVAPGGESDPSNVTTATVPE